MALPTLMAVGLSLVLLSAPTATRAQGADPDAGAAGTPPTDAGVGDAGPAVERIAALRLTTKRIEDLMAERLDTAIDPASLFRADLDLRGSGNRSAAGQRVEDR